MTQADPDTGPLLKLSESGLSTRQIARQMHLSQTTVRRKLARIKAWRKRQFWRDAAFCVLTACAVISTAALATIAW